MARLLAIVTLIVQLLMNSGMLSWFEALVGPFTELFDLTAAVVGPVTAYVLSPTVGITYMSSLLNQHIVSDYQAITALLAGSLLMFKAHPSPVHGHLRSWKRTGRLRTDNRVEPGIPSCNPCLGAPLLYPLKIIPQFQFKGMGIQIGLGFQPGLVILQYIMFDQGNRNDEGNISVAVLVNDGEQFLFFIAV